MLARRSPLLFVMAIVGLASLGCATSRPQVSKLDETVARGPLKLDALRIVLRDCARRFPAVLEGAATTLGDGPVTSAQRRTLIEFKANGAPLVQGVLLQRDPVAALLDGWVLLYQLRDVLMRSAQSSPGMPEAIGTVDGLVDELGRVWAALTGRPDVTRTRTKVEAWARAHPLVGSLLARESAAPFLSGLMDRGEVSVLSAAGTALESVDDAIVRLDAYAMSLPRQVRWQAEAAVEDMTASPEVVRLVAALDHALELAQPLGRLAGETSAIVARERSAVLANLDHERVAAETFLREERRAMVASFASERDATLQQAEGVADAVVDRVFERLRRMLLLVGVVGLGLLVAAVILGWLLLRRGGGHSSAAPSPGPRRAATASGRV